MKISEEMAQDEGLIHDWHTPDMILAICSQLETYCVDVPRINASAAKAIEVANNYASGDIDHWWVMMEAIFSYQRPRAR